MQTWLDWQGNIPSLIEITDAKLDDVTIRDALSPEPGALDVMDQADVDDDRLNPRHPCGRDVGIRAQSNTPRLSDDILIRMITTTV